jgi:hypothetical protein
MFRRQQARILLCFVVLFVNLKKWPQRAQRIAKFTKDLYRSKISGNT